MKLELTDQELDYILSVLSTRSYAEVAQLMGKISGQVQQQQKSRDAVAEIKKSAS